ncbi:hypothetical protein SAMN04487968_102282 [Nocardioides terrae]|uniref:Probable membrane transporter protein n=1 Tax=Nocardioides terrae TaxID=574651 RepID=A0A1I1EWR2_9ACTN|nr:sulfite exporter TauE/SafE family protein [Nocardioides terrae]SFB91639.1 hypothetical protein SAMN04487968_102282 [Nocardioides terrae]
MTGLDQLAVLLAGVGAGVMTSTVGVASLLSFPVLLAVGLPPVTANASNTVGLTPGAVSGSFGYRAELRTHLGITAMVVATCAIGAAAGAALLLTLPADLFEAVAPWLILTTCVIVGVQPPLNRWLRRRHTEMVDRTSASPLTMAFSLLVGVYGGYFGAGSGVMMMAVLGLGLDIDFRIINGLKTLAVLASNLVASVIFLARADLDWRAVALLAAGSIIGGYAGARLGRRLPPALLRTVIVVVGVIAATTMLL